MTPRTILLLTLLLACAKARPQPGAGPAATPTPDASSDGGTPCEMAYAAKRAEEAAMTRTLLTLSPRELNHLLGDGGTPIYSVKSEGSAPSRQGPAPVQPDEKASDTSQEKYVRACSARPPSFQRCLHGGYKVAHQEECRAAMTPDEIERFRKANE